MSGLHEVDCNGCGRRHVTNGEQARKQRVLRCDCGYFVRLDRPFADRRSEPTPPPVELASLRADVLEEDDSTHLMNSHTAAALLGGSGRSAQPSLIDDERVSRPTEREGGLLSRPSSPIVSRPRQPSIAPTEKPLWYVDLGGTELVQMTIEQLILARRGGRLGEGALVWREGMPSWRPVGTLIPATSASAHPAPLPSPSTAPSATQSSSASPAPATRTPFPARPAGTKRPPPSNPPPQEATPRSLGSYERPMATLEFALEKQERTPLVPATRSPLPSVDPSGASLLSRPTTPLPRASLSSVLSTPFPRPANLPRVGSLGTPSVPSSPRSSRPPPPPPPVLAVMASPASTTPPASPISTIPPTPASPISSPPAARESDRPHQQALLNHQAADTLSERPRWLSACIALVVCVTASAAGASLVRSLKQRPKAQAVAASSTATAAPVVNVAAQKPAVDQPQAAPSSTPRVVDVESLSVEHKRSVPRAMRVAPRPVPTQAAEASDDAAATAIDPASSAPATPPTSDSAASDTPSSSEPPAAARSNPYGSGSLIDQIKKATAEEDGQ